LFAASVIKYSISELLLSTLFSYFQQFYFWIDYKKRQKKVPGKNREKIKKVLPKSATVPLSLIIEPAGEREY